MCIDMCIDMHLDMGIRTYVGICVDTYTSMCIDVCIDMGISMCIDMWIHNWRSSAKAARAKSLGAIPWAILGWANTISDRPDPAFRAGPPKHY